MMDSSRELVPVDSITELVSSDLLLKIASTKLRIINAAANPAVIRVKKFADPLAENIAPGPPIPKAPPLASLD